MEILRKNQEEMLEIKNTVTGMKNVSGRLISRLGMFEERISEPEDYFNKILENQKIKPWKKKKKEQNIQSLWDNYKRCTMYRMVIPEGEEREDQKELSETMRISAD